MSDKKPVEILGLAPIFTIDPDALDGEPITVMTGGIFECPKRIGEVMEVGTKVFWSRGKQEVTVEDTGIPAGTVTILAWTSDDHVRVAFKNSQAECDRDALFVCDLCERSVIDPGFSHSVTCKCGAVWAFDEALRLDPEWVKSELDRMREQIKELETQWRVFGE